MARRAGYGALLRKTYPDVPVRYLDLGGNISLGTDAQRITTDALLAAMDQIKYEAMNGAIGDLGDSLDQSEYVRTHLTIPRLSANIVYHDTGEPAFAPYRILSMPRPGSKPDDPPIRIGLLGLVSDQRSLFAFGPGGRSLIALPLKEAIARYLPEVRSKSDLVVAMAETAPDPWYSLLREFKGIDLVVCGEGPEILLQPVLVEGIPLMAIGTQGKYIAELRVYRDAERFAIKPFIHWLDARFPENDVLAKSTEKALDEINEVSRRDVAADTAPPSPSAPYVGSQVCARCRQRETEIWRSSKHSRAFDTLVPLKRDYTITCVMCHVTAISTATGVGGFVNPRATPHLTGVQCESCHGPGESHAADPASSHLEKVPDDLCIRCHSKIQETYSRTGMARSFYRPRPENAIEDYKRTNSYYHKPSESYFTVLQRDNKYYQRRHQIGFDGKHGAHCTTRARPSRAGAWRTANPGPR